MECIKDARSKGQNSKKIENGRLERIFENKEVCMSQDFTEGSKKRRSEARTCKESILMEKLEEIGNRYMSRKKMTDI